MARLTRFVDLTPAPQTARLQLLHGLFAGIGQQIEEAAPRGPELQGAHTKLAEAYVQCVVAVNALPDGVLDDSRRIKPPSTP